INEGFYENTLNCSSDICCSGRSTKRDANRDYFRVRTRHAVLCYSIQRCKRRIAEWSVPFTQFPFHRQLYSLASATWFSADCCNLPLFVRSPPQLSRACRLCFRYLLYLRSESKTAASTSSSRTCCQ